MKKLLIVTATALGVALGGLAPAFAAPAQPTTGTQFQLVQAKKDEMPKKKKGKKKAAAKKGEPGEKKAKAKGKKKAAEPKKS